MIVSVIEFTSTICVKYMIRQKTIKYRKTVIFRYYSAENCKRTIKGGGPRRRGAETAVTGEADGERGGYPLNGAPIFGGRCAESGGQADVEEKSAKMTEAIDPMPNQRAVRTGETPLFGAAGAVEKLRIEI